MAAANSSALRRSPLLAAALLAAACLLLCAGGARAQAPAPSVEGGGLDCTQSFFNLTNCLSFVVVGSNDTAPDKDCCGELAGLFDSNPICLCQLLGGGAESFGISIDYDRALKLPSICHLDSLPVSLCSEIGIPVASPTVKARSPSSSISTSPSPSASGPQIPGMTPESPPGSSTAAAVFGAVHLPGTAALSFVVAAAAAGIF